MAGLYQTPTDIGGSRGNKGPNPQSRAMGYASGLYEPQYAALDYQQTLNQNHLGDVYARSALQQGHAGTNANFVNQDYGLGMEKIGLDRGAVGIDTEYQQKMAEYAQTLLGLNKADITTQAGTATRNQTSEAIANGALQSKNNIATLTDITMQRDNAIAKATNAYDQTKAGIDRSLAMNENQLQQLDVVAKELGLSRDKALAAINQGLQNLNLDTMISARDITDALMSGDVQRMQIANQVIMEGNRAYESGAFGYNIPGGRGGHGNVKSQAAYTPTGYRPKTATNLAGPVPMGKATKLYTGMSPEEQWIAQRESGGNVFAYNKTAVRYKGKVLGHAFGIGQLVDSNRINYAKALGIKNPNTTDYNEQLRMFRAYIKDRYGTAARAKLFWIKNGWY